LIARDSREVEQAVQLAAAQRVPITLLGGGSNVLVSDAGIRGLVLRVRGGRIEPRGQATLRADAGVTVNGLVRYTVQRGLGGLAAWAGTPGTVGGGVFGNAHFEGHHLSEQIVKVGLIDRDGRKHELSADAMEFGYDQSRLQWTGEVLLWADFRTSPASAAELRDRARRSLAFRKRSQPLAMPSAGCIFRNPNPNDPRLPPGMPASAGALIDAAGFKGLREGKARVSETHANFIVNEGGALAAEVSRLISRVQAGVHDRFGVRLREEIVRKG
jgi:UDP-N-acetylmuramate dehydrogenase